MQPILASSATLAVATIYVLWNVYRQIQNRRVRQLRSRVAYMLWVAANRDELSKVG